MSVALDDYDRAAARLHARLAAGCDAEAPFVDQVATALRIALDLFSTEPELARLLLSESSPDPAIAARRLSWSRAFAGLLRRAAMRSPQQASLGPASIEPHLIEEITSQLRSRTLAADPPDPDQLLRDLLALILPRYMPPGLAARAAANHRPELQTTDPAVAP